MKKNIVIIDNYDSFTYNLYHLVRALGADTHVVRNDKFTMDQLEPFDKIILSPGPGIPSEAGLLMDVLACYATRKPILGICLGHQAIGEHSGGELVNLSQVYHGVATESRQVEPDYLFEGLPQNLQVGRYHSWAVRADNLPPCLQVTSLSPDGCIMSMRHCDLDIRGIQYHPESVLTPDGARIIANWINR